MSYKIAIASTDGIHIDKSFKEAEKFYIYQVEKDGTYQVDEVRTFQLESETAAKSESVLPDAGEGILEERCASSENCGAGRGCGAGTGCGGEDSPKLLLIEDCRCLICTKTGFGIQKKLERKAISAFEIDCDIEGALGKITEYFYKVDNHQSLRGIAKQKAL